MKIYTKTGDNGLTSLANGQRVSKCDARIEAYGTADELNSFVGVLRSKLPEHEHDAFNSIQNKLFNLGALLSGAQGEWINSDDVAQLENWMDTMQAQLEPLRAFVLPAGSENIGWCHVCRTVTRRLERQMVAMQQNESDIPKEAMQWVNRLSDFWFVKALYLAKMQGNNLIFWKK